MKRIVYVIPYTSIIEQTADTFRKILGPENVLEHHSGVLFDTEEDGELTPDALKLVRATETWDMPVVVTTAVQFFESLFSCRPSQCRKLHNLAGASSSSTRPRCCPCPICGPAYGPWPSWRSTTGPRSVLCTATQPALGPPVPGVRPGAAHGGAVPHGGGGVGRLPPGDLPPDGEADLGTSWPDSSRSRTRSCAW